MTTTEADEPWSGKEWTVEEAYVYAVSSLARCLIVIDNFVVDVTEYLKEHVSQVLTLLDLTCHDGKPGGAKLLRGYAIGTEDGGGQPWRDASWAFGGGLNNHSRVAIRRVHGLRVAKLKA